jgi:hypothetical protein
MIKYKLVHITLNPDNTISASYGDKTGISYSLSEALRCLATVIEITDGIEDIKKDE